MTMQILPMKITVITVTYNSVATIADTVRSVLNQSYLDFEHLVIDGLSTDGTIQAVEAHRHPNLFLSSEPDRGIYDAMNKGFDRATGQIIGFLNADDLYADDDVLARIAKAFENNPHIDACFGDLFYVTEDNRAVVRYWKSKSFVPGSFAYGWAPAHPTFYIRRSALERFGGFDLSYQLAADTELMMRYLERGGARAIYIPRVQVRMRLGGKTNRSLRNIFLQNQEIFRAFKKNGIPFSIPAFLMHKFMSRLWQRWAVFRLKAVT